MKKIIFLVVLTSLIQIVTTKAQDEKFKALFIYNFTKLIDWPEDYKSGDFVITVFGDSPMVAELEQIAQKKTVINQKIAVTKAAGTADIGKCHMVYISPAKSGEIPGIISHLNGKPTIILSDLPGSATADINFIKDGDIKFEIFKKNIEKAGLKVSSDLYSLGIEK